MIFPEDFREEDLPTANILICNYNYAHYIKDAFNSALDQDYPKKIITIIDDKSTDLSKRVITSLFDSESEYEKVENSHSRIEGIVKGVPTLAIFLDNNVGPSEARNIGIQFTLDKSDVFQILDADDVMYTNKVSELLGCMMQSSHIGVTYGDCNIINVDTNHIVREYREPYNKFRLLEECIVHSGSMIKKEALVKTRDQFGYYDKDMRTCEDYDLWIRIAEQFMVCHVPKALTLVRVHNKNSTYVIDKQTWNTNWQRVRQKMIMRQQQNGRQV